MLNIKKQKLFDEKGLTLIEILAALVILGIVFIGFMSIFPQMTTFNKVTETKLKTMNIAKQEMADIQSNLFAAPLNNDGIKTVIDIGREGLELSPEPAPETIGFRYEKNGYIFETEFWKSPELLGGPDVDTTTLHQVHLKVIVDEKVNSETYGYIKVKGGG